MGAWVRGCVGAWVRGCVGAWVRGCVGAWVRGCVGAWVRGCVGAWVRGCVGAWVRGCVGAWVRGCVGAWVRGCVGAWVRGCVGAWVRGCVRVCVESDVTNQFHLLILHTVFCVLHRQSTFDICFRFFLLFHSVLSHIVSTRDGPYVFFCLASFKSDYTTQFQSKLTLKVKETQLLLIFYS